MSRCCFRLLLVLLAALPACAERTSVPVDAADKKGRSRAAEKDAGTTLLETWQAAYFEGLKVGHMHTVSRQVGDGAAARIATTRLLNLTIKRYGSVMPIQIEQSCEETPEGKVLAMKVVQQLGNSPKQTLFGDVENTKLVVRQGGTSRSLPWDDRALGMYAQDVFFRTKKAKPGDRLSLVSYELMLPGLLTVDAVVKPAEQVDQLVVRSEGGKERIDRAPATLVRVDATPQPLTVDGQKVQLPGKAMWLTGKLLVAREQFEMPGLGLITFYTTTRAAALTEGVAPERLPDFGLNINIPLKQTIDQPYATSEATYRVTLKEKIDRVFLRDARQEIANEKGNSFELTVKARREPGTDDRATPPEREYLDANTFLDSEDTRVRSLAMAVTRKETDPWKKAQALERWVHGNMKLSSAVGFPSASQVAKDLEGDCRQHAVLLAALCRAAGVPSRTAIGLIYVREEGRRPYFGFHMWTEVWVRGQWLGLDAILGQGGVGATHLKMADASWGKTQTLAPLLPIAQVLGKLDIDILNSR